MGRRIYFPPPPCFLASSWAAMHTILLRSVSGLAVTVRESKAFFENL